MKQRFLALLCCLTLAFFCLPVPTAQASSVVFSRTRSYQASFSDLSADRWYYPYAVALYEYGLSEGREGGVFAASEEITVAELLTFSARVRSCYENNGSAVSFPTAAPSEPWYLPYLTYLEGKGLLGSFSSYTAVATRAQMAGILAFTLPQTCYDNRNADVVTEGYALRQYITDVNGYTPYQPEILWLYKQGLLNGTDAYGTFQPDAPVTRAEVAAVLSRMLDPSLRLTLTWNALPYRSAAGATYTGLVSAPALQPAAPAPSDTSAIDSVIRFLLARGETSLSFSYDTPLSSDELSALTHAFAVGVKRYCEQMYNQVTVRADTAGHVSLSISSTVCTNAQLALYRERAMARAIAIHDSLWANGYLSKDMSEYEKAQIYFSWLCENCTYDSSAVLSDSSLSHLAYSALCNGVAVCDGYVGAYNLLLKLEGIECSTLFNDDHIWTVATLDGKTYHIDPTWGDSGRVIDWTCFGMTEQQSYQKHPW